MLRFSVVIPIYNVERFLSACFDSVRAQSFRDFEVVLVDDGSTDGSLDVCKNFEKTFELPVLLVSQKNQGLLSARRVGFAASSGEYIISLDGDDALHPNALAKIDEAISNYGCDLVFYGYSRRDDFEDPSFPPMEFGRLYDAAELRTLFCMTNRMNAMCFKAVARSCAGLEACFESLGRLNMGEDAVQSALVYDKAKSGVCLSNALYFYRPNNASISTCIGRSYLTDMERVHSKVLFYANKWDDGIDDTKYERLTVPRCAEEICHFSLHYAEARSFDESFESLDIASSLFCISKCASDMSLLSAYAPHTRFMVHLLARRQLRLVWIVAQAYGVFASLKKGR